MPQTTCGYEVSSTYLNESSGEEGTWTCPREAVTAERCIWHAPAAEKSVEDLLGELGEVNQPIHGARLGGLEFDTKEAVTFEGLDMIAADFEGAQIVEGSFDDCDLAEGDFTDTTLENVEFRGTELSEAKFRDNFRMEGGKIEGKHHGTIFRKGTLRGVLFEDAEVIGGDFVDIDITRVDGSELRINRGIVDRLSFAEGEGLELTIVEVEGNVEFRYGQYDSLNFRDVDGFDVTVNSLKETGIQARRGDFGRLAVRGGEELDIDLNLEATSELITQELDGGTFRIRIDRIEQFNGGNIDIGRLELIETHIEEAALTGLTTENGGEIEEVEIGGGVFEEVTLPGGTIESMEVEGVTLDGLDVEDGQFFDIVVSNGSLTDANLTGTSVGTHRFDNQPDFQDIKLVGVTPMEDVTLDFSGLDMRGADLSRADFRGGTLQGSNLEEATLEETDLRDTNLVNVRLAEAVMGSLYIDENTEFGPRSIYEYEADAEAEGRNESGSSMDVEEGRTWRRLYAAVRLVKRARGEINWRVANAKKIQATIDVYRNLQKECAANALPKATRTFRIREKEARRKRALTDPEESTRRWIRLALARWVIQHGERYRNLIGLSILVIFLWGLGYMFAGGVASPTAETTIVRFNSDLRIGGFIGDIVELDFVPWSKETVRTALIGLYFSAITFSTLGYGNFHPGTDTARLLAAMEAFIGAAFTALLVFIVARRATSNQI